MRRLNRREKLLTALVGGAVVVLLTLVLLNVLLKQHRQLRQELAARTADLETMQVLLAERELWQKRDAWVLEKQPKLTSESRAGGALLDEIKAAAGKHGVTIESPAIGTVQRDAFHVGVPVNFETKSSWAALVKFLGAMQGPDQFLVFDSVNIQIDPADPTMIRGKLTATRWHAPKS